jgi:hypothetical protein
MSDNGYQKMSVVFMKTCARLAITQAFTSYNNPTGSADTEWLMRTLKEELLWHHEWTSLRSWNAPWRRGSTGWYNKRYLDSAVGYWTPCQVEQQRLNLKAQFVAA